MDFSASCSLPLRAAASPAADKGSQAQELDRDRLLEVCQEFESLFWHQVLRQMRQSVPQSDFMHGGFGEDVFQDLMDQEYGKVLAAQGGPGSLSRLLFAQLGGEERVQESDEQGESEDTSMDPEVSESPGADVET